MTHQTEAACLFETGALYGRRTLLRPEAGDPVFAGFKPGAFSVYFGDAPIFHFDRDGRWQRAFVDGLHYLKSLDGSVRTIDRVREDKNLVLKRTLLTAVEADASDALVRSTALGLIDALDHGRLTPSGPPPKGRPLGADDLRDTLERVASWDAAAWLALRERYRATYSPIPFMPPDCPAPLILQATLGHESGVAFGGAPDEAYVVRSPHEFEVHARDVAALLGRRFEQCKTVFLAGADVLRRPVGDVTAYLDAVGRVFPIDPTPGRRHPEPSEGSPHRLDGVHAFLDRFGPPLPSSDDWRRYRERGMTRVGLGIESGAAMVRELYGKSWPDEALRGVVSDHKAAGIGVSLALLVGAGGVENARAHVAATVDLVTSLDLGPGDLVSLLDAREVAGGLEPRSFTPLDDAGHAAQSDELRARLEPVRSGRKAKVVPYSLEKQAFG
jgi:hypothetical protein